MGCLKLAYYQTEPTLKVAYRNGMAGKKVVQCWLSMDPLAEMMPGYSPYAYTFNNPLIHTDPTGMAPKRKTVFDLHAEQTGQDDISDGLAFQSERSGGGSESGGNGSSSGSASNTGSGNNAQTGEQASNDSEGEGCPCGTSGCRPCYDKFDRSQEAFLNASPEEREEMFLTFLSVIPFEGAVVGTGAWLFRAYRFSWAAKGVTKLLSQFSGSTIDDDASYALRTQNNIDHIFAAKHNLGPLESKLGGQQNTVRAALNAGNGMFPSSGVFKFPVNVVDQSVWIKGTV